MLLCFHSFSCFENRDTTGDMGDTWWDMKTSSTESGSSRFVEITKQQTCSKNLNLSLMPTEQHLSMGQQYPAFVINQEPWAKAAAELRNYEEDPFFSKCPAIHQFLPAKRCKILSPCKLVLQPELNCKTTCTADRSLPACTARSSNHIAGATTSTFESSIYVFSSFHAPSVSPCLGFFLGTLFPTQQSAAHALDRRSLHIIFEGAVLLHAD